MEDSLLIVDDEVEITHALRRVLRKENYRLFIANSAAEALSIMEKEQIGVLMSDHRMPHMTGAELMVEARKKHPETIRIILSGYADFNAISDAINHGAISKFLVKPWDTELLIQEIRNAFTTRSHQQLNNQMASLFNSTQEAIILCNCDGIVESVNPAFEKLTGYSENDVIGLSLSACLQGQHGELVTKHLLIEQTHNEWHGELSCIRKDNEPMPVWLSFMATNNKNQEIKYTAQFIDISEHKKREARAQYQAYHDELTGLPNRRSFNNQLELTQRQQPSSGNKISVLFIDIDRFKRINDNYGHSVGDEILNLITIKIRSILPKGNVLARYGSDQFVILIPSLDTVVACEEIAASLLAQMQRPITCMGHRIYITLSIGIAIGMGHEPHENLIHKADSAMYKVKSTGGNDFQFFDQATNQQLKSYMYTEDALQEGLANNQFEVFYQPKVNPATGTVEHCEALVRWRHPECGIIPPGMFIDVAEQTGLISKIGQQIIRQACAQLHSWKTDENIDCHMAINLSAVQFNDNKLIGQLIDCLEQYHISPSMIELEITESVMFQDLQQSISTLNELRRLGFRIALDDFGTGYSSLNYLKQLPIDTLKIDRAFVQDLPDNECSAVITSTLLRMAKELGLEVVAEGVETQEQCDYLHRLGCDLIQGYLISAPLTSAEFVSLAKKSIAA